LDIGDRSGDAAVTPKLRVAWIVADGYWWAAWYLRDYAAMALAWAAVAAGAQLLLGRLLRDGSGGTAQMAADYAPTLANFAVTFLGAAAVAVAAYRLAVLEERPQWRHALRIGRRQLRVFGLSLLIYAAAVVEMIALTIALHAAGILDITGSSSAAANGVLSQILATILWSLLIALTITPFIGLAFPLAALDAPSGLFRRSFEMARGHRLRLAAIAFVADLPWVLASYIPWAVWGSSDSIPDSVQVGLSTFITLLGTAFGAMVFGKAFAAVAARQRDGVYGIFD